MQILIATFLALIVTIPGIFLVVSAVFFKKKVKGQSGILILIGSILILAELFISSGTYYASSTNSAEYLALYALQSAWLQNILHFLGLVLIATGLLSFKKK